MFTYLQKNIPLLIAVLGSAVVITAFTVGIMNNEQTKKELAKSNSELSAEINQLKKGIKTNEIKKEKEEKTSVKESTGLDLDLVDRDQTVAEEFFKPAFNWKSSSDYDKARDDYQKKLGKNNTFTKTYMPADTKIDTNDGKLSHIDFNKLKVTMDSIQLIPTSAKGDDVSYVAFVTYYVHKDDKDLADKSALEPSEAIMEFTGTGDKDNRLIRNVTARAGFSSSKDFN